MMPAFHVPATAPVRRQSRSPTIRTTSDRDRATVRMARQALGCRWRDEGDGRGRRSHARASATSTRCSTRTPGSPRARSSTTTSRSPTCSSRTSTDRLLTRKRWPDGTASAAVLREERAARAPPTGSAPSMMAEHGDDGVEYVVADDAADPGLARQPRRPRAARAAVEGRTTTASRTDADLLVFDLDPGPPADIIDCFNVALALRAAARRTTG